jgi:hypothetical protein
LFQDHGIACVINNDWVVPNAELPALRALWHPGDASGRLDVQVLVRDQVVIEECFAGVGEGERGMYDALASFMVNSFHVLLAAFWGRNDPEQVTTERWTVAGKPYVAYIGNFATRSSEDVTPHVPSSLFADIESAIKSEALTSEIHWYRLFFANFANAFHFEALKDNESWEAGIRWLKAVQWEQRSGYYSVRLFALLRAA